MFRSCVGLTMPFFAFFMRRNGIKWERSVYEGRTKTYGFFVGVQNYFALFGKTFNNEWLEKIGYYGEELVLLSQLLGIETCWVSSSYSKKDAQVVLKLMLMKARIWLLLQITQMKKQTIKDKIAERFTKAKTNVAIFEGNTFDETPDWFKRGLRAVEKAPSMKNLHPYFFLI